MTDAELLIECKKGLGQSLTSTASDAVINQKVQIVKSFMMGAGVSVDALNSFVAIGAIVCGVTDIWQIDGGGIKFSPLFYLFVNQLR